MVKVPLTCSSSLWQHLKTPPQSVVLVGHSMGGVVARALFTLPRFNSNLVSLIITQASPHLAPVLALDPYLLGESNSLVGACDAKIRTCEELLIPDQNNSSY